MAAPVVIEALWLMLPAYVANMLATLVGGGRPVDGGRLWKDGRRVLGDGKTWRGLVVPPVLTIGVAWVQRVISQANPEWGLSVFGPAPWWALIAWSLAAGALVGDMAFSFLKRRRGMAPGTRWLGPDQLDFVLGAWGVCLPMATALRVTGATEDNWFTASWGVPHLLLVLVLTPGLHLLVNYIGYHIGAKKVPW